MRYIQKPEKQEIRGNSQIMKLLDMGFKIIMLNMLKKMKQNLFRRRNGNYKKQKAKK